MISFALGKVTKIISINEAITELEVEVFKKKEKAVNYNNLTGNVFEGDKVLLNRTAVKLQLGTGGYNFVVCNYSRSPAEENSKGHIMKLRYTPMQLKSFAVEEEENYYSTKIKEFISLYKMPVIVGTLHSQLPAVIAGILSSSKIKPVYIMTDGGALPISFSKTVRYLKDKEWIKGTVTAGNAFGGDLESVNIYTAIIAAQKIFNAQIAVVIMGPGVTGTGTEYGYTGIEQGEIINSIHILGGIPVAVPRISFSDKRERHYGISHHTLTALGKIALKPAFLPIPDTSYQEKIIQEQLYKNELERKHQIINKDTKYVFQEMKNVDFSFNSMGRGLEDDPEFFKAAAAAGVTAVQLLE